MPWETSQSKLVRQLRQAGRAGDRVLRVIARVPRDMFVPEERRHLAFDDVSLPIGWEQTISQPSVVAAMTEALEVEEAHHVLEVGTGSGYQAAVLAELAATVVGVERNPWLAGQARRVLAYLGYANVEVVEGDGSLGWPAGAPYDRILVAAAGPAIPSPLLDQLASGGRLVMPIGGRHDQRLVVVSKGPDGTLSERHGGAVCFVPLLGAHGWDQ